jgi:site-specific recombinase XerD
MVVGRYLAFRVEGPLAPAAAGLWGELLERGFSLNRVRTRMRLVLELSRWMDEHGVGLAELNAGMLEMLVSDARAAGRRESCWFAGRWFSSASERDVLAYLRELGLVEPAAVPAPTQVDLLIARFVEYLARERGTANRTSVYWYERIARSFLTGRVDPGTGMLAPLTAGEVTGFLLGECRHCSRWTGMRLVSSLRGLLRFLLVEGLVGEDLTAAVPRLPAWSLVALPKALTAEHADRILASCDRSTAAGCRDYAIYVAAPTMLPVV